jgi:hypothetical protein
VLAFALAAVWYVTQGPRAGHGRSDGGARANPRARRFTLHLGVLAFPMIAVWYVIQGGPVSPAQPPSTQPLQASATPHAEPTPLLAAMPSRLFSAPAVGPARVLLPAPPEVVPHAPERRSELPPAEPAPLMTKLAPATATKPERWVRTHLPSALWSGPDGTAQRFTDLPKWSWLRVVDEPRPGADRLQVYYPGDGATRLPGPGWVPLADVGPVGAPDPKELPAPAQPWQLPEWVQVHRATTFWSSAEADAAAFTDLPQWSYLKVRGAAQNGRLLVDYPGDYATRQAGPGWVDESAVGAAANPGLWLRNHRASARWSGPDGTAQRFGDLPQWSYLRILEGAPSSPERVYVFYFGDGEQRQAGPAWVPLADVGPVTPPAPLPEPQRPGSWVPTQVIGGGDQRAFIERIGAAARESQRAMGVPASVTIAQAILESNWGRSRLAREGKNLFGIKALNGPGSAGTISLPTWEHLDGRDVVVEQPFKAYASVDDSIKDHGEFFRRNRRYRAALAVAADARAFARAIHEAGYATDPAYPGKLIGLMDRFDLYRYDVAQ